MDKGEWVGDEVPEVGRLDHYILSGGNYAPQPGESGFRGQKNLTVFICKAHIYMHYIRNISVVLKFHVG